MKKVIIILINVLIAGIAAAYIIGIAFFQTHFRMGTNINGFNVSLMTVQEVEDLLSREADGFAIAINTRNNGVEKIEAKDIGMKVEAKEYLTEIMTSRKMKSWLIPETAERKLPESCYTIDKEKLEEEISNLNCMKNIVKAESAKIVYTGSQYQVEPTVRGTELDKVKTRDVIETAIRQWKSSVDLEEAGCYIDAKKVDEKELQKKCEFLNSIQDTIITYDFGDRKESIDIDVINTFLTDYELDNEKITKYISSLAEKYDTVGKERKFITYDDRTVKISGGNYGWKMDVDSTAASLKKLIQAATIDVVEPEYLQEAADRSKNDLGHSYLEIDLGKKQVVLYIDGEPKVQADIELNGEIEPGFYNVSAIEPDADGKTNAILFGSTGIYLYEDKQTHSFSGTDDISAMSSNGVEEGFIATTAMNEIFALMKASWPVVVYYE